MLKKKNAFYQDGQTHVQLKTIVRNLTIIKIKMKKSDLTFIKINVICEVPFYFINIIKTNKII